MTIFGPGINIGPGITAEAGTALVTSGLTVNLDAATYSGSGSTWSDISGNSYTATLYNTPTYSTQNTGYFVFNGTNQYATVSGTPLNTTAYTKQAWFMTTQTFDNNLISSDVGGHYMFFNGTNRLYCGHTNWTGFPTTYASTATFSNNVWYLATVTFDTTNGMAIYINGSLDSTYTVQKTAPTNGTTNLACYAAAGNLLRGRIAQALIYNRALTASEVLQNYNATKARFSQ